MPCPKPDVVRTLFFSYTSVLTHVLRVFFIRRREIMDGLAGSFVQASAEIVRDGDVAAVPM